MGTCIVSANMWEHALIMHMSENISIHMSENISMHMSGNIIFMHVSGVMSVHAHVWRHGCLCICLETCMFMHVSEDMSYVHLGTMR